jgi:uncharacterized repeat protein (TIGR02543 family)
MNAIIALFFVSIIPISPSIYHVNATTHALTFRIINDTQSVTVDVPYGEFYFDEPSFIPRDNVRLNKWYADESLTIRIDFEAFPIIEDTVIYARWEYLISSFSPAQIFQDQLGDRFQSGTMTLTFPLYEPLAYQVLFQWQQAPINSSNFRDIGGAIGQSYTPIQNGTLQYRIEYKVPLRNDANLVIGNLRYYSSPLTITIFGQQTITPYLVALALLIIISTLVYITRRRMITYLGLEEMTIPSQAFKPGEDITLQPKPRRKGYNFIDWYMDKDHTVPFELLRMPLRSFNLYAKFSKKNKKR